MTKVIGLTGRSGAGKGAVCDIFAHYGIPSIDTDALYHEILAEKGACTSELASAFGNDVLDENGLIDRKKLAERVFGKPNTDALLHTLNGITHKYIMAKTREQVLYFREHGAVAVLIDAPQLFEAGAERECDLVLGILAPTDVCLERIVRRDHIERDAAHRRLSAQHDDAFFRERCDAVIENNGDIDMLKESVCRFLTEFGVMV